MGILDANNTGNSTEALLRAIFANMHTMLVMPLSSIVGDGTFKDGTGLNAKKLFGKVLAYNAATSALAGVSSYLEAILAEILFIAGKIDYYKFLLNPQNVQFQHSKLQTVSEATDLTIINSYRNSAVGMNISGISGNLLPIDFMKLTNSATALPIETMSRYPKLSAAYIKFRQLEKFYKEVNSDIVIMYDMDLYIGKFVSFDYSQNADNPWVIDYNMNFKLYPQLMLHTLSVYDYAPFFGAMVDRYGKTFANDFEGKSVNKDN